MTVILIIINIISGIVDSITLYKIVREGLRKFVKFVNQLIAKYRQSQITNKNTKQKNKKKKDPLFKR